MRVAYLHRTFPGPLGPLVGFVAAQGQHCSVFVAEKWARSTQVPGVRKARIPGPEPTDVMRAAKMSPENRMSQMMCQAAKAGDVLLHLRKGGFVPDVLYGTADDGYLLYARDIFPKARLVVHLSWFYERDMLMNPHSKLSGGCGDGNADKSVSLQTMMGRVHNCLPLSALNDCDLALASSSWQMRMFSHAIGSEKIKIVKSGVDSHLFRPGPAGCAGQEIVTLACQGDNPARGIGVICASLPHLLERRPDCRLRLLSFAPSRSECARQQHAETLAALLPPLSDEQRQRVDIVVSPSQNEYVALLQSSAAYVYLTSPTMLSAGILEAMSCGVPVIASDSGPVRELVQHGVTGFLCTAENGAQLAESVGDALEQVQASSPIGRNAREMVLAEHDLRKLLPRHANCVLGLNTCAELC